MEEKCEESVGGGSGEAFDGSGDCDPPTRWAALPMQVNRNLLRSEVSCGLVSRKGKTNAGGARRGGEAGGESGVARECVRDAKALQSGGWVGERAWPNVGGGGEAGRGGAGEAGRGDSGDAGAREEELVGVAGDAGGGGLQKSSTGLKA